MRKYSTSKALFNMFVYMGMIIVYFDMVALVVLTFLSGGELVRTDESLWMTLSWLSLIGIFIAVLRIVKIIFDVWVEDLVERRWQVVESKTFSKIIKSIEGWVSRGKEPSVEFIQHTILNGASKKELISELQKEKLPIHEKDGRHDLSMKLAEHWLKTNKFS